MPASDSADETAACREIVSHVSGRYDSAVKCTVVSSCHREGFDARQFAREETGEPALRYGHSDAGRLFLVRPDGYIDFRCQLPERQHLLAHLQQWLI
ncbi:MAG: hypothetical protein ACREP6_15060 [Candidatus Binataceae bacterium]